MNFISRCYEVFRMLRGAYGIDPRQMKITIEFLHPEAQLRAERALRMEAAALSFSDPKMIDSICEGQPFTMFTIPMQVKTYKGQSHAPKWDECQCVLCRPPVIRTIK